MRLSFKTRIEKKSGLSRARRLANRLSISAQVTKIIVYCLIKKKREILSDQSDSSLDQRTNREKVAGKQSFIFDLLRNYYVIQRYRTFRTRITPQKSFRSYSRIFHFPMIHPRHRFRNLVSENSKIDRSLFSIKNDKKTKSHNQHKNSENFKNFSKMSIFSQNFLEDEIQS